MRKESYRYGKCHVCGSKMEPRIMNQEFRVKGKLIEIENVPAGVCTRCGARIVSGKVGLRIEKLLRDPRRLKAARTLTVPVLTFPDQVA